MANSCWFQIISGNQALQSCTQVKSMCNTNQ